MEHIQRRKRSRSLAAKLSRPFLVVIVVSLLLVGASLTYASWQAQRQRVVDNQRKSAAYVAATINLYLQQTVQALESFAQAAYLERGDRERQTELIKTLWSSRQATFNGLTLLDANGQELAKFATYYTFLPSDLTNQRESQLFQRAISGQVFIADKTETSPEGKPILRVGIPIRLGSNAAVGVVAAEVSVKAMVDTVQNEQIGQLGYAYVVDQAGRLIAHKDQSTFLQLRGKDLTYVPLIADIVQGVPAPRAEYPGLGSAQVPGGTQVIGAHQQTSLVPWYVVTELPSGEAYAPINAMLVTLAVLLAGTLAVSVGLGYWLPRRLIRPLSVLTQGAQRVGQGDLQHRIDVQSNDELETLAEAFNAMAAQLRDLLNSLEVRVQARTAQLRAGAEVARAASSILDPQELMQQTVNLIQERFGFYYAGIFLLDEQKHFAVLRAGTGEAGRKMLAGGHKLDATTSIQSMVGWACANKQARIALDVGQEAVRFANPLLPSTRSEIALPLRVGDRILGALDVQSEREAAFDEYDIAVLQSIADQVAVALDNAQLFAQSQANLENMRRAFGELSVKAWADQLRAQPDLGFRGDKQRIERAQGALTREMQEALRTGQTIQVSSNGQDADTSVENHVAIPIKVRGQAIAVLDTQRPGGLHADEIALLETLAEQLGVALESARLYQDSQRRAARERILREVTARVRSSSDPETVLHALLKEIGTLLGRSTFVRLVSAEQLAGADQSAHAGQSAQAPQTDDSDNQDALSQEGN